jgi:hypothetical protein
MNLPKWINDCITEDDGLHVSGAKITAYTSIASYIAMAAYVVYKSPSDDLSAFNSLGSGLAFVLAGGGALIGGTQATMQKLKDSLPKKEEDK